MAEIFESRPLHLIAEQAIEDMMKSLFEEMESSLMSAIQEVADRVDDLASHLGC